MEDNQYLDEDGYPTEEALKKIETWDHETENDVRSFFEFIESIWHLKSWGWHTEEIEENGKMGQRYYISTAGWSGNESLIRAFEKNEWLWFYTWESSHRGGHYEFEYFYEDANEI